MGRKPKWLYETLPYAYMVAGIATAGILQNAVATISGVLLLSAGALVMSMRHTYRANATATAAVAARDSGERNGEQSAELLQMNWRSSFEVGHEAIDRQHERLLSLGNQLVAALMERKPREDVELMMGVLVTELGRHLKMEAELAAGHQAPLSRAAQEAHRALLARATELSDRYSVGQLPAGDLVGFIAFDLIVMHIVKEDLRFMRQAAPGSAVNAPSGATRKAAATADSL